MIESTSYPEWFYYPSRTRPPDWVPELLAVVEAARPLIDSATVDELTSDKGRERVAYEVDAVHDGLGIVLEVEAGRGARGNAVYRDLVRSSLIVDQRFLVLGVM